MTASATPVQRSPRRRIVRLLVWGTGLLLPIAAALALFLSTLDATIYRRALEAELSDALDRPVSVGSLSFAVSLRPTLSARDLRIANPPWASRPDFATAGEGAIHIDLAALWHGKIDLRSVDLRQVDILFERNADGAGNWTVGASGDDSPADLPDFDAVSLSEARIGWRAADGAKVEVQIETANATVRRDRPFQLEAQGVYRGTRIEATVKSDASLQTALAGDTWAVAIALETPGARATIEARLPTLSSTQGVEATVELSGERLDAWSKASGTRLPAWGPYRVSARTRYAQASLQVDDLRLSLDGLPLQPSHLEIAAGKAIIGTQVDTRLAAEGKLGEVAFSLEATSAPLPRLLKASGALPISARGAVAGVALSAEGTLGVQTDAASFDLSLTARGDALALARAFGGAPAGAPIPVDLSARVSRAQAGYAVRALRGRVVECTVAGDLTLTSQPRHSLGGTLTLGQLDLRQFPLAAAESARGASARPQPAPGPAPPAWLSAVDTDLAVRIAGVAGLSVIAKNIAARVRLRDGVLALEGFGATLADIDVSADGVLRWSDGRPQVDAKVRIPVLDLAHIRQAGAQPAPPNSLDRPLALARLRDLDATLQLDIGRIAGAHAPFGSVTALARLTRGKLAVDPVSLTVAQVPLRGRVVLDASRDDPRLEASASAQHVDVAAALRALKWTTSATGQLQDLQLALDTHGTTLRALVAQAQLSVRAASANLTLGRERTPVALRQVSVEAARGAPLRASVIGSAQGVAFEATVSGGALAELLEPERAWPKVQATLRTSVRGQPMSVTAASGPLQRLLGLRDVPVTVQAELAGARASLQGTLKDLTAPLATALNGRIEVASLTQLAPLLADVRLPDLALTASGRVALGDSEISLDDLAARIGKSDASGRLRLRWRDRFNLNADITSKLLDLAQWDTPSATSVPVHDRRLALQPVRDLDAQLRLRAERIILAMYDLDRVVLDAKLTDGLLELSAAAAEGNLHGELRFDTRQNVPSVAGRLSLREVEMRMLYTPASGTGDPPLLTARAQFAAAGATLREMLGSTQGEFVLTAGAGNLPMNSSYPLERLTGNLLTVLVPGRKPQGYTQLQCAAARFTLANGVATSTDGIALRFKEMDILGGGAVNLNTGQIQFGYRAVRRNWLSFSAMGLASGLAVVGGTIDKPTVQLDPTGALIRAGAAYATAGLSILAGDLWRKLEATADPCARISASASGMSDPLDQLTGSLPKVGSRPPAPARP